MKTFKKTLGIVLAMAMVVGAANISAFAASSSKNVKGYGTLYGSVNKSGRYTTKVSKNTDKARLTISGLLQDKNGKNIDKQRTIKSDRGAKVLQGHWNYLPAKTYAIYGAHGVQDGIKYKDGVVYTVTHTK